LSGKEENQEREREKKLMRIIEVKTVKSLLKYNLIAITKVEIKLKNKQRMDFLKLNFSLFEYIYD
jgi:hypothetical protein